MIWLVYTPLAATAAAVALFVLLRLSRRGWGPIPRRTDPVHVAIARALNAAPVIDDAGLSWRLRTPEGARITLPFGWSGADRTAWAEAVPPEEPAESDSAAPPASDPRSEIRNFAFLLRGQLKAPHRLGWILPVGCGLPLELLSYYHTTADGMPLKPADGATASPRADYELREARLPRILRAWAVFDRDLSRLAKHPAAADPQRAFLLSEDGVLWLNDPLWPEGSTPPTPFLMYLLEDEVAVLAVFPGRSPADAFDDPLQTADTMRRFADALPALTHGALQAQRLARLAAQPAAAPAEIELPPG